MNIFARLMAPPMTTALIGPGACTTAPKRKAVALSAAVKKVPFGKTSDGTSVNLYILRNKNGAEAKITEYGGTVVSLTMPDRAGIMGDVVLGYATLKGYLAKNPYFGSIVGRLGNRLAKGSFTLSAHTYQLAINDGPHHLHGGIKGFDKVVWTATPTTISEGPSLELSYISKDGEEGYPGTLTVKAVYTLTEDNALKLEFTATTDKPTICNLTHHSYFNLACSGDILNHEVTIPTDMFVPVDETLIPIGEFRPVKGTPFDFTQPTAIGARINDDDVQLKHGKGYDHSWAFAKKAGELTLMATVYEPTSGRVMEVLSTEPGIQFYSGNFLDGTIKGKGGVTYAFRSALCMEPQHYPDSPNQPNFPPVTLNAGKTYSHTLMYRFAVK